MKAALMILATLMSAGMVFSAHADEAKAAIASGTINMAANMNELALACGHMSSQDVETGRIKQRDAAIKDLGVAPASYDKMYAGYASDFKKKWGTMTPEKQKSTCAQMKR
ncbi:hypothetical protein GL58_20455 [Comamonas testosteroni]|uniref:Uncharacterized protein n=1 Tax=Comamonas testosteroni TaxID=285 RepID=A0A0L7MB45_COMTE|nr:hypothetical protein [Comamonas testosteroni]KOC19091.1 hypothetical protein GL58_20455 [Comamonas testosteroni]